MIEILCMILIAVWIVALRLAPYAAKYIQIRERARLDALKADYTAVRINSTNSLIETRKLNHTLQIQRQREMENKIALGALKILELKMQLEFQEKALQSADPNFDVQEDLCRWVEIHPNSPITDYPHKDKIKW